mmetsp:Transcript_89989/g.155879  ORF Transcript_89989/g.155879 Transcript_89989/m.155879 type:complete len:652 (-) Transcript_89989:274-2229(-)
MMCHRLCLTFCLVYSVRHGSLASDTPIVEYSSDGHSEYHPGTLPLLLSGPHGGTYKDPAIPTRVDGCCPLSRCKQSECTWPVTRCTGSSTGCTITLGSDYNTRNITLSLSDAIYARTGKRPHVVVANLHRSLMDPNGAVEGAAQDNPTAVRAWNEYHAFLARVESQIIGQFQNGLLLDIHGHAHTEGWIELGYLLGSRALNGQGQDLDAERSSISHLAKVHASTPFEQILRGDGSLGALLSSPSYGGYRTVPSPTDPGPDDGNYFSGGYITRTYSGKLDAIQIELPSALRSSSAQIVQEGVTNLAAAAIHFMSLWYDTPTTGTTTTTSAHTSTTRDILTTTLQPGTTTTLQNIGNGIQSGDRVFLRVRDGTGNHIDVQGSAVQARWKSRGNWQAMTIEKENGGAINSGDTVYLKAHTGVHVDVQGETVQARWQDHGDWQAMKIQKRSGGSGAVLSNDVVCLEAHTGKHVDFEDSVARARWHDCGDWQAMLIEKEVDGAMFSGDSIQLLAHTGKLVDVEGTTVQARWSEAGEWQRLVLINPAGGVIFSGDVVFLKCHTGAFIDIEGSVVKARWNDQGHWQQLVIEKKHGDGAIMPGDTVVLRAHTGKMLAVQGDDVQARWVDRGTRQYFVLQKSALRRMSATGLSVLSEVLV